MEKRTEAKSKYIRVFTKLKKQIEKNQTATISRTIKQVKETWKNLEEAHSNYVKEVTRAENEDEARQLVEEFGDLESDLEEIFANSIVADSNEAWEAEPAEEAEKAEIKGEKNKKSLFMSKGKPRVTSDRENVQHTVQTTLGKITVSKDQYARFQDLLKDQMVDNWEETSASKVFQGVQIEKYPEFLELFRTSTGIDDKVLAEFKAMEFTDRMDDKVKSFTCESSHTGGKYGIYMAVKRPQENKIDVAYAMYDFKAKFTGNSTAKPNNYNIWNTMRDAKTGLYRLTTPVVENILTGKLMKPNRNFTVGDINELTENYIVAKALQAFAHYGIIPKVTWAEDVPKIDQESKPQIEEVPEV